MIIFENPYFFQQFFYFRIYCVFVPLGLRMRTIFIGMHLFLEYLVLSIEIWNFWTKYAILLFCLLKLGFESVCFNFEELLFMWILVFGVRKLGMMGLCRTILFEESNRASKLLFRPWLGGLKHLGVTAIIKIYLYFTLYKIYLIIKSSFHQYKRNRGVYIVWLSL